MLSGKQQCSEFLSRILTGIGLRGRRAAREFHLSVSASLIVGQRVHARKKEVAVGLLWNSMRRGGHMDRIALTL